MIRKLFFIISVVSVLALFNTRAEASMFYEWVHEDGDPFSAMEGTLQLKNDAWDGDGWVLEGEVQSWTLNSIEPQNLGFHNAGSHNPLSSFNFFALHSGGFGSYEVHFPRVTAEELTDPGDSPANHDFPHWIRMDHNYNWGLDHLSFIYTYGISKPSEEPIETSHGSGYFQRVYDPLSYIWINDNPSYTYNIEATLTVKGDAWADGYLYESEVISWSVTSSVPRDSVLPALGFYDAGSFFPGSSFLGFPLQPDSSTRAPLWTNGLGGFTVYFPRVTAAEVTPPDTPANHDFDHWMIFEQYDLTPFNVDEIPMTFTYGVTNPDPQTTTGNSGRFVRIVPVSGDPPPPPPVLQLPLQSPVAQCQDVMVYLNSNGTAVVAPVEVNNDSTDPDGDPITLSLDRNTFDCNDTGANSVTLTVTDDGGLSDSCTATVFVVDNIEPVLSGVPADVTVECDSIPAAANPSASDNCDTIPDITFGEVRTDGDCPNSYTLTRTWTATDDTGNSTSQSQTITVVDTNAPTITCPADVTLECPADTSVAANGSATGSDTCGGVTITSSDVSVPGCGDTEVITRTWTATDDCGNSTTCDQTITVIDTTPPSLVSDVHDIYPYDAPVIFNVMTSDTCGDVDLVLSYNCHKVNKNGKVISKLDSCEVVINGNQVTVVDSGGVGTIITISATATDDCGNATEEDFVVNVLRPANEGVGNGVDANTPGHDNNGGNDDPGFGPGNPGAKNKKK
jgi:hypothetical protein